MSMSMLLAFFTFRDTRYPLTYTFLQTEYGELTSPRTISVCWVWWLNVYTDTHV